MNDAARERLGDAVRSCRAESPEYGVGTPGTYGFHHERLFCTLLPHVGDAHLCDEGDFISTWTRDDWTVLRHPKRKIVPDVTS